MKHKDFILMPLISLIEKALLPMDLYKGQVCNYIMKEYVLQTLFLQLTGCMEQKAKCILWDIATHDFEFRRKFLHKLNSDQGEYSTYKSKNTVYMTLIEQLQVEKIDDAKKEELLKELEDFRNDILEKSIAKEWLPRELQNLNISNLFNIKSWGEKCLFEKSSGNNKVYDIYESLYDHRNRCSHNTLSYQGDMIGPKKIKEIGGESYASWFTLLVLIDMIYSELYGEFSSKSH